jgi:hypothetical protein
MPGCCFYSFVSDAVFLVRTGSTGRTESKKGVKIAQVIESKTRGKHRPGREEENVRTFERVEVLAETGKR